MTKTFKNMKYLQINQTHLKAYNENGYVIIHSMFSQEEINLLMQTYLNDKLMKEAAFNVDDGQGMNTKLTLWYKSGDDIYGAFSRCKRVVDGVEKILGGPVALYHTKFMQKEPRVGGAWEWHQDYGYWYDNGFLYPEMLSVMVAVTKATKENGCLQVLKGSHKIGRINHGTVGEQVGADVARVQIAREKHELVYVELNPGDVLFFHSNLLHRSDSNRSEHARFSMISAYNLASNKPFKEEPEASYTPVVKIGDEAVVKIGIKGVDASAEFLNKQKDKTWKASIS